MAGLVQGVFPELLSAFLKEKLASVPNNHLSSRNAIERQYLSDPAEEVILESDRRRHYESELTLEYQGSPLIGIERLYKKTVLIEPTTACAAHCRWCLRGLYPSQVMTKNDLTRAAMYIGSPENINEVDEVLITGGDPFVSFSLLEHTLQELLRYAPNIRFVRIGTRVPVHNPALINDKLIKLLSSSNRFNVEVGLNINHPVEFWPETKEAINKFHSAGISLYSQHPLLKGVNDDIDVLVSLYSLLRENRIQAHYLFHAIPLAGAAHHRTSLSRGLQLACELSSCGSISGRAKPKFAVLSDIGKIVMYEDTIVDVDKANSLVLLRSGYNYEDRLRWNPTWKIPDSSFVGKDGLLYTWYQDSPNE